MFLPSLQHFHAITTKRVMLVYSNYSRPMLLVKEIYKLLMRFLHFSNLVHGGLFYFSVFYER